MSRFSRSLSRDEIDQIGVHAARRNAVDGITGVLLTLGSVFFQIFEGDEPAIDDLYARVLRDDRHTDVICLKTELDVPNRLFPDWSMNVFDLELIGGEVVEPLKLVLDRMSEAQHIVERYTQPAVSRIVAQGLNPLDIPLRNVERLVLFTDMVAFSAITHRLPIESVSDVVTAYLETCSTGIADRGGEVTKFLGDGVMAYFDAENADEALQACVDVRAELRRIRDDAPAHSPLRAIYSGFGLAVGPVVEGTIGSSVKMDYTIIGEPVNTAAKLEALTRTLRRPVLMTEAVARASTREGDLSFVGAFDVGLERPIRVHGLEVPDTEVTDMGSAVRHYLDQVAADRS